MFITDRGKPAHVLLTSEECNKLASQGKSIAHDDYDFAPQV